MSSQQRSVELAGPSTLRYLARQPILDLHNNVVGYELLFRDGTPGFLAAMNSDRASMTTMDSSLLLGVTSLTGGKRAFINCTRELLVSGLVTLLPPDLTVLEILEDVQPDDEVLFACRRLRQQGYSLAMDDFVAKDSGSPLLGLVRYVKVDLLDTSRDEQRTLAHELNRHAITLVAEKVETRDDHDFAVSLGFTLFQGYYFCRPVTLVTRDIPTTTQKHLRLLQASQSQNLDIRGLEKLIRPEVALCYRLLRYLNSAAFGLYPVRSIRHALTLLGEREIRKWIAVVTTAMLAHNKPTELVRMAMVRARFCESFAPSAKEEEFFLGGLFSLLDAMLDRPMDHLVHDLPISAACRSALLNGDNEIAKILEVCRQCERADFSQFGTLDHNPEESVWRHFRQATLWADSVLDASL